MSDQRQRLIQETKKLKEFVHVRITITRVDLCRTNEAVVRQAGAVEDFLLLEDPQLKGTDLSEEQREEVKKRILSVTEPLQPSLDRLKAELHKAGDSGSKLVKCLNRSEEDFNQFYQSVKQSIYAANTEAEFSEAAKNWREFLLNFLPTAKIHSKELKIIAYQLNVAQLLADKVEQLIKQKAEELGRKAQREKWLARGKAAGFAVGAAGAFILSFFSAGLTFKFVSHLAKETVSEAKKSVYAASCECEASRIKESSREIVTLAANLTRSCETFETLQSDMQIMEPILESLKTFTAMSDYPIAELENQLRSLGIDCE